MTEQTADTSVLDTLERVTVTTDGGVGKRGRSIVVYMTPEDAAEFIEDARRRRRL